MLRYPPKNHWPDIASAVGHIPAEVRRWEETVRAWKLAGWNPQNTAGMLDHFNRREIPSTRPAVNGSQPRSNGAMAGLSSYEQKRRQL